VTAAPGIALGEPPALVHFCIGQTSAVGLNTKELGAIPGGVPFPSMAVESTAMKAPVKGSSAAASYARTRIR
jgi:hypothetical protein